MDTRKYEEPGAIIRSRGWVSVNGLRRARQGPAAHAIVEFALRLPTLEKDRIARKNLGLRPQITDASGNPMAQVWDPVPTQVDETEDMVMVYYGWIAVEPLPLGDYTVGVTMDSEDDRAGMGRVRQASLTVVSDLAPELVDQHRRRVLMVRGEYGPVVAELERLAAERTDDTILGMELIDAYLVSGRLDEAEATVRRHLYRASCGGQPASCRPDERVRHYLMPYLDQIRAAEVPVS